MKIHRAREGYFLIPPEVEDAGLSVEAFRVYAHLARKASEDGLADFDYAAIGEFCFRGSRPDASKDDLEKVARDAMKELIAHDLIEEVEA